MSKRKSLKRIGKLVEQRYKLVSFSLIYSIVEESERANQVEFLGKLALYREEIALNRRKLKEAVTVCNEVESNVHSRVVEILVSLPEQSLSKSLITFIELLPSILDNEARNLVDQRDVLNNAGVNLFKEMTDEQLHQQNLAGHLRNIEITSFIESYTSDLAQAKLLAELGADPAAIRDLLV